MTDFFSFPADKFILIGKVVKAHGLKGEVKIHSFSGQPGHFNNYQRLILVDTDGRLSSSLEIIKYRVTGKSAIIQRDGIDDRNQAERICSMGVLINKSDLPNLRNNEFYYHELIGLPVQTKDGKQLGKVDNIFSNGAQEIMEIKGEGEHYLIPVVQDVIIDLDTDKIIIAPPPGLLDMNKS